MSLYDAFSHKCVILTKTETDDGEGGRVTVWTDGDEFSCAIGYNSTAEQRRAEQQGLARIYGCMAGQDVDIHFGDYFRDAETGITFRITSEPCDNHSPACASMLLNHFTAERRDPPT